MMKEKQRILIKPGLPVWIGLMVLGIVIPFFVSISHTENMPALPDNKTEQVTALVETTEVIERNLQDIITAYGLVIPAPGSTKTLTLPFECIVRKVFVGEGELLKKGSPFIKLSPSPATLLMMKSAENSMTASRLRLKKVRERLGMKLATATELIEAEKAYNLDLLRFENLKDMGLAENITMDAKADRLITRVYCRAGQIVSPGAPIMDMAELNMPEAVIGIEPSDIHKVSKGQRVLLEPVNRKIPQECNGTVRSFSRAVNSSSGMIDLFVSLQGNADLLMNEFLKTKVVIGMHRGLIVPISALLPFEKGFVCFTVKDGIAKRRLVERGWQGRDYVEIISGSIKAGDEIIKTGNYELSDGMAVRVAPDVTNPSSLSVGKKGRES